MPRTKDTTGAASSSQPTSSDTGKDATTSNDHEKAGSKGADDEQVSVNPIPATGHENVQSSVTTSKEEYEKIG